MMRKWYLLKKAMFSSIWIMYSFMFLLCNQNISGNISAGLIFEYKTLYYEMGSSDNPLW